MKKIPSTLSFHVPSTKRHPAGGDHLSTATSRRCRSFRSRIAGFTILAVMAFSMPALAIDLSVSDEAALNSAIVQFNAAGAGQHSITLTADVLLTAPTTIINNVDGELEIIGDDFAVDGQDTARCFNIAANTTVTIRDLTITRGRRNNANGGGILNSGVLTLERCAVTFCSLTGTNNSKTGAGIYTTGTLTILDSRIEDNQVGTGVGGGISGRGTVHVQRSLIARNRATWDGGGGWFDGGNITFDNCTFSDNFLTNVNFGKGGAVYVEDGPTLNLNFCTATDNRASQAGGSVFARDTAVININGSIMAGNNSPTEFGEFVGPTWNDLGYNIVGDTSTQISGPNTLINTDPLLDILADNGGPTMTHALLPGSPAVGIVPVTVNGCGDVYEYDGNSTARPQDDDCDCGATEFPGAYVGLGLDDAYSVTQTLSLNAPAPGVLTNDLHGAATAVVIDDVDHGVLTLDPNGGFTYTPNLMFSGTDSFTYLATGPMFSDEAVVTIIVEPASCAVDIDGDNVTDFVSPDASALRAAYAAANPGDTLRVSGTCAGSVSGEVLEINKLIEIRGGYNQFDWSAGADPANYPTIFDAEVSGRVLNVLAGGDATVRDVTLTGGRRNNVNGGGILNSGVLTLERCAVTFCSLTGTNSSKTGAGIYTTGTLTILDSRIEDNQVGTGVGGGISGRGTVHVQRSLIARNRATWDGGGGWFDGGNITFDNCTFSDNFLTNVNFGKGGAVYVEDGPTLNLNFCTATDNRASQAGGSVFARDTAVININGSIMAGNNSPTEFGEFVGPTWNDLGYNIVGDTSPQISGPTTLTNTDPLLDILADNGGPTLTHALQPGSPAIDYVPLGTNGCGTTYVTDQRGDVRPDGGGCELGAVELVLPPGPVVFVGAVDDNWFDAGNWNLNRVPRVFDSAVINGGFDVTAFVADSGGAPIDVTDLSVADDIGNALLNTLFSGVDIRVADAFDVGKARFTAGLSTGRVDLSGASVIFTNDDEEMEIGSASDPDNLGNVAHGKLNITDGSIINVEDLDVGQNFQDGGEATGELTIINGDIQGTNEGTSSDLYIGRSDSASNATGTLRVENGEIRGFGFVRIGTCNNDGGIGSGTLALANATAAFDPNAATFVVANNAPSGAGAFGLLDLESSYLSAGDVLMGEGTTFNMTLDGLTRAADNATGAGTYSAMDFTGGFIEITDATLNVDFTFAASIGDTFDLITLAQGAVFSGSLFDEINVSGLGSGLAWQTDIIPGTGSVGEIYRIAIIPEGCIPGDLDGSDTVDISDVAPFAAILLDPASANEDQQCTADVNEDESINGLDLQAFLDVLIAP